MCSILRDVTGVVGTIIVITLEATVKSIKDVAKVGCKTTKGINDFIRG